MKLVNILALSSVAVLLGGCGTMEPMRSNGRNTVNWSNSSGSGNPTNGNTAPPVVTPTRREETPAPDNNASAPSAPPPEPAPSPTDAAKQESQKGSSLTPKDNSACTTSQTGGKCCDFPHWLNTAKSFLGTHEGSKATGEDPTVKKFHEFANFTLHPTYSNDGAWCGSFVNWCLRKTNNPKTGEPYPPMEITKENKPYRAKAWIEYGEKTKPCFGAIMVMNKKGTSRYHVAFCAGIQIRKTKRKDDKGKLVKIDGKQQYDDSLYYVALGGNQDDEVNYTAYPANRYNYFFCFPKNYKPCTEHYNLKEKFLFEPADIEKANGGKQSSGNESTR